MENTELIITGFYYYGTYFKGVKEGYPVMPGADVYP